MWGGTIVGHEARYALWKLAVVAFGLVFFLPAQGTETMLATDEVSVLTRGLPLRFLQLYLPSNRRSNTGD